MLDPPSKEGWTMKAENGWYDDLVDRMVSALLCPHKKEAGGYGRDQGSVQDYPKIPFTKGDGSKKVFTGPWPLNPLNPGPPPDPASLGLDPRNLGGPFLQ